MTKVNSADEARVFFTNENRDSCICVAEGGKEKEVDCYPEALIFFEKYGSPEQQPSE